MQYLLSKLEPHNIQFHFFSIFHAAHSSVISILRGINGKAVAKLWHSGKTMVKQWQQWQTSMANINGKHQ